VTEEVTSHVQMLRWSENQDTARYRDVIPGLNRLKMPLEGIYDDVSAVI
jgi:hypothetical protein